MTVTFHSNLDRAEHPQGKLVNSFLMGKYFQDQLTDTQIKILSGHFDLSELEGLLQASAYREKIKLLICYFCGEQGQLPAGELPEALSHHVDKGTIVHAAALTGRFAVIRSLGVTTKLLKTTLENSDISRSLLSSLSSDLFIDYLELEVSEAESVKDLFILNDFYKFYREACQNGHLEVIRHLEDIPGFIPLEAAKADGYFAYQYACLNGYLDVVRHLEAIPDFNPLAAAEANDYFAYQWTCDNGHLEVIKHLEAIPGFNPLAAVKARDYSDNYAAYRHAFINGHLDVIRHIEDIPGFIPLEAAKAAGYGAYRNAFINGDLEVIRHLEDIPGFNLLAAAKAGNYVAYRLACENGHLEVVRHLEAIPGFDKLEAAKAGNYVAYRLACENGHLDVVRHLESIPGFNPLEATKAGSFAQSYEAYRHACKNGHLDIIEHLLNFSNVFSYAERHDCEFGRRIYSYVGRKLRDLQSYKQAFEVMNPNGVFDINVDEARHYFLILRNLIRRGARREYYADIREAEDLSGEIRFLLSIPAIRELAHQAVTVDEDSPGQENELLRLALRIGNRDAADILIRLPEVRLLAGLNDFYRGEARGDLDLRALAQDRESSMTALSVAEQGQLEKIKSHYQPTIDECGGIETIFEQFMEELKRRYEESPASISCKDVSGNEFTTELPFEWGDWFELSSVLTREQKVAALKAYYQHDIHTVYRYLSKPNYWMAPNASYVYVLTDDMGHRTNFRYSTFEEYINIIAPFYLAVIDERSEPIDGYSLEDRFNAFIKQLALIGRAHNWDNSRPVVRDGEVQYDENGNVITEEYDDLEGDKPSCFSGVKRRLFQSVLGHSLFKPLTKDVVLQALNEVVREYYQSVITSRNAPDIKKAYEAMVFRDFDGITQGQAEEALKELDIPEDEKTDMINAVLVKLASTYEENVESLAAGFSIEMKKCFEGAGSFGGDFISFSAECGLVGLLEDKCRAETDASPLQVHSMFSHREDDRSEASETAAKIAKRS